MTDNSPLILAVDTSCDDTSASVVKGQVILSNVIASQADLHKKYGGVFPTVAKQAHKENILPVIKEALKRSGACIPGVDWGEGEKSSLESTPDLEPITDHSPTSVTSPTSTLKPISALAVTVGPGLAPALEVGIKSVRDLAQESGLPLIAVNHIEGHILSILAERKNQKSPKKDLSTDESQKNSAQILDKISYPVLAVVVSGKHTEFVLIKKIGQYQILGSTIDDAAGECLDKMGRMVNLGYPAGGTIEEFAKLGNPNKIEFPLPMTQVKTYDMSFSGLKTFARNYLEANWGKKPLNRQEVYDFCASAQYGVFRHICYKLGKVLGDFNFDEVWIVGGVAQNTKLRQMVRQTLRDYEKKHSGEAKTTKDQSVKTNFGTKVRAPFSHRLCMDNAAMIGVVAGFKYQRKEFVGKLAKLDRKPRWGVDQL
jgi:N6-L-threonylcarbamoyladenine synthase